MQFDFAWYPNSWRSFDLCISCRAGFVTTHKSLCWNCIGHHVSSTCNYFAMSSRQAPYICFSSSLKYAHVYMSIMLSFLFAKTLMCLPEIWVTALCNKCMCLFFSFYVSSRTLYNFESLRHNISIRVIKKKIATLYKHMRFCRFGS